MNRNKERIFFIFVVLIEFLIINIFYWIVIPNIKNRYKKHTSKIERQSVFQRFFSFYAKDRNGNKILFRFNNYSNDYYMFLYFSKECSHCKKAISDLENYIREKQFEKKIPKNLHVYGIGEEFLPEVSDLKSLILEREDAFQFGFTFPTIVILNCRGDLLYKKHKVSSKELDFIFKKINNSKRIINKKFGGKNEKFIFKRKD